MLPDETPAESTEAAPSEADTSDAQAPSTDAQVASADPVEPEQTKEAATDEPEALAPSAVHPAAAAGFTEADVDPAKGEFYIGMWNSYPNYGCPYCFYSSIDGSGDIELHILSKIDSGDINHRKYLEGEIV